MPSGVITDIFYCYGTKRAWITTPPTMCLYHTFGITPLFKNTGTLEQTMTIAFTLYRPDGSVYFSWDGRGYSVVLQPNQVVSLKNSVSFVGNGPDAGTWRMKIDLYGYDSSSPNPSLLDTKTVDMATLIRATSLPSAPVLLSPRNMATGVPIPANFFWCPPENCYGLTFQLALDSGFNNLLSDDPYIIPGAIDVEVDESKLSPNTTYYWRVNARNEVGQGSWSQVYSFTTGTRPNIAPDAPFILDPITGVTGIPSWIYVSWTNEPGATSYRLQLSRDANFTDIVLDVPNIGRSVTPWVSGTIENLSPNTQYFFRVNASNSYGTSNWSQACSFTTANFLSQLPSVPVPMSPTNGATNVPIPASLRWNPSQNAVAYRVQVARDNAFASLVFDQSNIQSTEVTVSNLQPSTQYFWRVNASNSYGTSDWSQVWSFTTAGGEAPPPETPPPPPETPPSSPPSSVDWAPIMAMVSLVMIVGMVSSIIPKEGS